MLVFIPDIFKLETPLRDLVNIVNVSVSNMLINFKDFVGSLHDSFPRCYFKIA
jgi:hypothetical protein